MRIAAVSCATVGSLTLMRAKLSGTQIEAALGARLHFLWAAAWLGSASAPERGCGAVNSFRGGGQYRGYLFGVWKACEVESLAHHC